MRIVVLCSRVCNRRCAVPHSASGRAPSKRYPLDTLGNARQRLCSQSVCTRHEPAAATGKHRPPARGLSCLGIPGSAHGDLHRDTEPPAGAELRVGSGDLSGRGLVLLLAAHVRMLVPTPLLRRRGGWLG